MVAFPSRFQLFLLGQSWWPQECMLGTAWLFLAEDGLFDVPEVPALPEQSHTSLSALFLDENMNPQFLSFLSSIFPCSSLVFNHSESSFIFCSYILPVASISPFAVDFALNPSRNTEFEDHSNSGEGFISPGAREADNSALRVNSIVEQPSSTRSSRISKHILPKRFRAG